jgi:putative transcriptional regulator
MNSLQGQLLIASPGLADPNFARTVVLIAVHGEEGALGLILNREMNTPLPQIWSQVSESECLMALHDQRPHANLVVSEEVYVATELNAMESLAASEQGEVLFYIGHSGWGPGQLETELADGSWLVLPAAAEHVFGDQDTNTLWRETLTEVGRRQVQSVIPIKHVPDNPRLN